jgi:hypothetical protein
MHPERYMHHDITHWPVTGTDGFGGFTFGPPVLLQGRWEDTAVQFRTISNEEETSNSVAYLLVDVDIGDYLAEGDYTSVANPTTVDGHRVRQRHRTTDLQNLSVLRKVFL